MCALRNMKNENNAEKAKKEKAVNQKLLRRKLKVSTCKAQKLHVSRKQGKMCAKGNRSMGENPWA